MAEPPCAVRFEQQANLTVEEPAYGFWRARCRAHPLWTGPWRASPDRGMDDYQAHLLFGVKEG